MRDNLKNGEHFRRIMQYLNGSIQRTLCALDSNSIASERVNIVKQKLVGDYLRTIMAKYSVGDSTDSFKEYLLNAIDMTYESWDGSYKMSTKIAKKTVVLNQYSFSRYDEILCLLSLSYLLELPDVYIKKIIDVIDRDGVKDFLLEFIIRSRFSQRAVIGEESYQKYFGVPDSFKNLRQAIVGTDKSKTELLVREFVSKDWYKCHKKFGLCDSKQYVLSEGSVYYGYWSWETAAVVKIMGLDDSSFKDCPYYPKDMLR